MQITPIKTKRITAGEHTIYELLGDTITSLPERSIIVVTSKIIALCENRVAPLTANRNQLIYDEADLYCLAHEPSEGLNYHFTIKQRTLIPASGIDASNADGALVLWPANPLQTANDLRDYFQRRFDLHEVGVIITDSTINPSRWGTLGIAIGYSGFAAIRDYTGKSDLFGRKLRITKANVAGGLAAAAVVVMGEGAEQTPLAVITDTVGVTFRKKHPSNAELNDYFISPLEDEPYKPFFNAADWRKGNAKPIFKI